MGNIYGSRHGFQWLDDLVKGVSLRLPTKSIFCSPITSFISPRVKRLPVVLDLCATVDISTSAFLRSLYIDLCVIFMTRIDIRMIICHAMDDG